MSLTETTNPMRRPSDLRKERPARRRRERRPVEGSPPPSWPAEFASAPEDREAVLVLLSLPSSTPRRLLELADAVGTASACLAAVRDGEAGSERDVKRARELDPNEVRARLNAIRGRSVPVHDAEYPPQLLDLYDPPAGLFVLGERLNRVGVAVAIVGARNCSPGGREMSKALGRALARAGACVVSGGARGIDAAAHRGALEAGGQTICVLGCGLDVAYPPRHQNLLSEIAAGGALVTEYGPGIPAEPFRFPARNRLVAALTQALVVVEGAAGSGSTITAEHALELGREVFAVPGAVTAARSATPLELIRDGATLIRGPDDLLEDLGLSSAASGATSTGQSTLSLLPEHERRVWEALGSSSTPDGLSLETGLPLSQVIAVLTSLDLHGLVRLTGGRYERRM